MPIISQKLEVGEEYIQSFRTFRGQRAGRRHLEEVLALFEIA